MAVLGRLKRWSSGHPTLRPWLDVSVSAVVNYDIPVDLSLTFTVCDRLSCEAIASRALRYEHRLLQHIERTS